MFLSPPSCPHPFPSLCRCLELMEQICGKGKNEPRVAFWSQKFPTVDREINDVAAYMFAGLAQIYPGMKDASANKAFKDDCLKVANFMHGFYQRFSEATHHNTQHLTGSVVLAAKSWPAQDKRIVQLVANALGLPYQEIDLHVEGSEQMISSPD